MITRAGMRVAMRRAIASSVVSAALAATCTVVPQSVLTRTPLGLDEFFAVPDDNPLTTAKAALGRRLFFDPILSVDRQVACASCHRPDHFFADTTARAVGVYGRVGPRNVPSIVNTAYSRVFSWDGRAASLEEQVLRPIRDPLEMDLALEAAVARLQADRAYRRMFRRTFRAQPSRETVAYALASFLRTVRTGDAPIDRYHGGDATALSPEARQGLALFLGRANCAACHLGPMFSDEEFHNTGVSWGAPDAGRYAVTGDVADRGAFNTPSLRNVACTAPYMHDGSLRSLAEVVDFYDGGAGVTGLHGMRNPYLDEELRPLRLSGADRTALVAFLRSLGQC